MPVEISNKFLSEINDQRFFRVLQAHYRHLGDPHWTEPKHLREKVPTDTRSSYERTWIESGVAMPPEEILEALWPPIRQKLIDRELDRLREKEFKAEYPQRKILKAIANAILANDKADLQAMVDYERGL